MTFDDPERVRFFRRFCELPLREVSEMCPRRAHLSAVHAAISRGADVPLPDLPAFTHCVSLAGCA